ncbi:MAG: hypothetical protein CMJ59_06980 [Planctomycetaceae bacterium]|nr:hypothetical protein [Planctomycetaceae bacterium]
MAKSHSNKCTLIPAVAYYRMSSEEQDKSIASQREVLVPWAKRNGYDIVCEYVDEAISGDKSRDGFHQLVGDASSGKWSAVLMWDQDRWSRHDSIKTAYYVQQLRENNCYMHTMNQGRVDWESFEERIIWTVQQEAKHMFLHSLAKNTIRGKTSKARTGRLFPKLPRGYSRLPGENASVALNEEAPLVKAAFEAYASGYTIREVADQLCEFGVTDKSGGLLAPNTVRKMLRNPFYFGRYEWNRDQSRRKYADRDDLIRIDNNHPAIVSRELFDRVQGCFKKNQKKTSPKKVRNYALSGLLRCRCGKVLYARTAPNGKRYYRCQGGTHGNQSCKSERVVADDVENALALALGSAFSTRANIDRFRQSLTAEIEQRAKAAHVAPGAAEKRVESLRVKLRSVERRLAEVDSDMLEVIQERIRDLRKELRRAEAELSAARAKAGILSPEEIKAKQEQVIELLANLPRTLSKLSAEEQNRMLTLVVDHVDVDVNALPPIQPANDRRVRTRPRYELAGGTVFLAPSLSSELFTRKMSGVVHDVPTEVSPLVASGHASRRGHPSNVCWDRCWCRGYRAGEKAGNTVDLTVVTDRELALRHIDLDGKLVDKFHISK